MIGHGFSVKNAPSRKFPRPPGFSVKNAPEGGKQQQRKAADAAKKSKLADFQGATKFMGVKKGYVFKKGPKGIGYYVDPNPPTRGWINTGLTSDNFI
mmetsp:Transcript_10791/g.30142  ORF Transcript_10791/g.30142 Transcript_10791/m.30142 type:complete len:97 (+) Transcript_10791:1579-1869(+)